MDEQLVNDFVAASLIGRIKELQEECDELETHVKELEEAQEKKSDEVGKLRDTIKKEKDLKYSALAKIAQIDCSGTSTASMVYSTSQWSAISNKPTDTGTSENPTILESSDVNLQRRMMELELQLISQEREKLSKHKGVIEHFQKLLDEKRQQSLGKEEEIQRIQAELEQKQLDIDRFYHENGSSQKTSKRSATVVVTSF